MIISMPSSFFVPITYSIELITDEKFKVSDEYRGKDNFNIYKILDEEYADSKIKSDQIICLIGRGLNEI